MHIAAYVLVIRARVPTGYPDDLHNNSPTNLSMTNLVLKNYFIPLFTAYGPEYSLCVCEDKKSVCSHTGKILFHNYERFLKSVYADLISINIQVYGDICDIERMIEEIKKCFGHNEI